MSLVQYLHENRTPMEHELFWLKVDLRDKPEAR
jgi:hypothetical protein